MSFVHVTTSAPLNHLQRSNRNNDLTRSRFVNQNNDLTRSRFVNQNNDILNPFHSFSFDQFNRMPSSSFFNHRPNTNLENRLLSNILNRSLHFQQPHIKKGSQGASMKEINLPTEKMNEACPICLETSNENKVLKWSQFPCCKNYIHIECAKKHLQSDERCPMCRKNVL